MFMLRTQTIICILCLLGAVACVRSAPVNSAPAQMPPRPHKLVDEEAVKAIQRNLEAWVWQNQAAGLFPTMGMGVIIEDKLVYQYYVNSNPDRMYHVASLTKTVVATAIMQLVEQGRLSLDQSVDEILPGVVLSRPEFGGQKATVRNLLSHSAGLPDMRSYEATEWVEQTSVPFRVPMPIYPPGRHFRYSNQSFLLLGEILKKITGQSIEEYVKANVFIPAGMTTSTGPLTGAGGVQTNIRDLGAYANMYLHEGRSEQNKVILRPQTVRSMLEQQTFIPYAMRQKYQGLGWRVERDEFGPTTYFHIGGDNYVAAWIQMFPQYHAAIFYLGDPPEYSNKLHTFLTLLQMRLGDVATVMTGAPKALYDTGATMPAQNIVDSYTGLYRHSFTGKEIRVTINQANGQRTLQADESGYVYPLYPNTTHTFLAPTDYNVDFFVDATSGTVQGVADMRGYYVRVNENTADASAAAAPAESRSAH